MPSLLFFIAGIVGMTGMSICAAKLDGSDVRSNWIEQGINSVTQAAFFVGLLLI